MAQDANLVTVRQPSRTKGMTSGELLAEEIRASKKRRNTARSRATTDAEASLARRVYLDTHVLDGTSIAPPRRD